MKRFVLTIICIFAILLVSIYGLVRIVERQILEIDQMKQQIESLKLENQRLKNELKPYREAESYIRKVNPKAVKRVCQIVNGAKRYGLPFGLILLAAHAESDFRWDAVGLAGEHGPLQVMPGTFRAVGGVDFDNIDDCFEAGLLYLSMCYKKARGDYNLALAYYNGGLSCKNPLQVARRHVSRCRVIRQKSLIHEKRVIRWQRSSG